VTAASVAAISREMSIKMLAETAGGHQAWVDFYLMATDGGALQYARKLNVSQALQRWSKEKMVENPKQIC
jgi:hypothetical protein